MALASVGTGAALVLFGLSNDAWSELLAGVLAGAMWTWAISALYVSAQVALPDWVRGRGLAIFLTFIFGATTFASAIWGQIASLRGVDVSLYIAAAGAVAAIPLSWGSKLQTGLGVNLAPSLHWRTPRVAFDIGWSQGPVLVTLRYRIEPQNRDKFLSAMREIGSERKRDGAFAWGVFEELAEEGRYTETFLIEFLARADVSLRARHQRGPPHGGAGAAAADRAATNHPPDRAEARASFRARHAGGLSGRRRAPTTARQNPSPTSSMPIVLKSSATSASC